MIRSTDRILTTHAGSLPRPDDLRQMVAAKLRGEAYDEAALAARLPGAIAEVVKKQVECGLDSVNDGEFSKANFTHYVRERMYRFGLVAFDNDKSNVDTQGVQQYLCSADNLTRVFAHEYIVAADIRFALDTVQDQVVEVTGYGLHEFLRGRKYRTAKTNDAAL